MNQQIRRYTLDDVLNEFLSNVQTRGASAAVASVIAQLNASGDDPMLWQLVAEGMILHRFLQPAIDLLDAAMQKYRNAPSLHYWRGNALRLNGRGEDAEQDFRIALQNNPGHREAALSLAFMLRQSGRLYAAAEVIVASWQNRASDVAETLAALAFLLECGAHVPARDIANAARQRWPENAQIAALAGELDLALGEFDAAADALRNAVILDPEQNASWLRLSYCQRYSNRQHPDLQRIESAWSNTALSAQTRTCAGFALGKALDDLGDYANASEILRSANAMARAGSSWRDDRWQIFVDQQINTGPLPALENTENFTPIFIVGLPRTGTTLVATLLARHPLVRNRGELNWLPTMYQHLVAQNHLHDGAALNTVAGIVSAQMRRDDAPACYYVDKNPLNFRYLNLILALFPNARIIHCRRDLRDTALSLWMQHFAHEDLGFAYDFASIAEVAKGHDRLMTHWRANRELQILDLDYAALVAQPTQQIQRLAEFLDVAAIPMSQVKPLANIVSTASVWQARQPVYTHAVGRWQNYAPYLPELGTLF